MPEGGAAWRSVAIEQNKRRTEPAQETAITTDDRALGSNVQAGSGASAQIQSDDSAHPLEGSPSGGIELIGHESSVCF
jgi:hypothetical protein